MYSSKGSNLSLVEDKINWLPSYIRRVSPLIKNSLKKSVYIKSHLLLDVLAANFPTSQIIAGIEAIWITIPGHPCLITERTTRTVNFLFCGGQSSSSSMAIRMVSDLPLRLTVGLRVKRRG